MPISRELLDQLRHVLRPIATRVANTVGRGVVQRVNDDKKMQLVQLGVLESETVEGAGDGAEHFQPYGFSSVPLVGAEHVTLFPNGDRSHPLTIAVSDRRYKPRGRKPGDVDVYHYKGAKVRFLESGDIEIQPGPGGGVLIREEGGQATKLPTLADYNRLLEAFNAHTHAVSTAGTASAQTGTAAKVATAVGSPTGTSVLRAE